jgi:hypothetical protein
MGVPQLMMILEPNIVWDHTHAFNNVVGKEVEAQYCPGTPAALQGCRDTLHNVG